MNNPLLVAFGIGVAAFALLVYFAFRAVAASLAGTSVRARARRMQETSATPDDESIILHTPDDKPPDWDNRMDAGFENMVEGAQVGMKPDEVLAMFCLIAVLLGGTLYLWRDQLWLGVAGGVVGLMICIGSLWLMRGRARAELQQQLPDFFFLLARSLRSGLNLDQALRLAIDQNVQPLSEQVRPLLGHLRVGMPLPKALERLAQSIQLLDFDTFVSVIGFHRANGGNLALLLDRLGQSVRDRNQFRGHLQATTAQARFTALLVALVGPLLLVGYAIFQPPHIQPFFQSPWGWAIVAGALLIELVAAVVMYQILRIDY